MDVFCRFDVVAVSLKGWVTRGGVIQNDFALRVGYVLDIKSIVSKSDGGIVALLL